MFVNKNNRSFTQFLIHSQENVMYAPHETTRTHPQAKRLPKCSNCNDCAVKLAEQARLIAELQAKVASQQQELASKDFVASLFQ